MAVSSQQSCVAQQSCIISIRLYHLGRACCIIMVELYYLSSVELHNLSISAFSQQGCIILMAVSSQQSCVAKQSCIIIIRLYHLGRACIIMVELHQLSLVELHNLSISALSQQGCVILVGLYHPSEGVSSVSITYLYNLSRAVSASLWAGASLLHCQA